MLNKKILIFKFLENFFEKIANLIMNRYLIFLEKFYSKSEFSINTRFLNYLKI